MRALFSWQKLTVLTVLVIIAIMPAVTRSPYIIHLFNVFFIWSIVVSNWNLIMGYAGIWSMANVAFLVIGCYSSALLSLHSGLPPMICIPLSGLITMLIATLFVGLPSLRLRGIYIALLSMIFANMLLDVLKITRRATGGSIGLPEVPPLFDGITPIQSYYINFSSFVILLLMVYWIIHSRSGLAFVALRDAHEMAKALGISEYREKLKVFALSSFMTGIAGGLYVHYTGIASPDLLYISTFLMAIAMMVVGGMGRFPGGVLGAALFVFGGEWLRLFGIVRLTIMGGLICIFILFFPGGIMELIERLVNRMSRSRKNRNPVAKVE
ncbi:MAG: branched-chain amino acid ABC transporter permease [bacterium]|nr:branched-chain amino acid ABC transporter permease [bacterium]